MIRAGSWNDLSPRIIFMLSNAPKPRPLLVLLPLLVGHLALLSVQVKDVQGQSLLLRSFWQVISPLLLASHSVEHVLVESWDEYVDLRNLRSENSGLRKQIASLKLKALENRSLLQSAARLRSILKLGERLPFKYRVAQVISRSSSFLSFTIMLNRGSYDGVEVDNPVITLEGIVGRIITVFQHTSEVQVLLDLDAAAGAMLSRTRVQGILKGTGGPLLKLNYLLNQEDVQLGDLIVTSSLDSIYPKDFPLGKVVRVGFGEAGFKEIDVLPMVKFNRIEEVFILLKPSSAP